MTTVVKQPTIPIDGSMGEGGGQILRTSLSLSLITGKPFRIENIRAKREKPGLLRQHLTAVQAAAAIGNAKVEGDTLGSRAITFIPGTVWPGDYQFAVGTAGSGTLVLQTILPPLMMASTPSRIVIEGGTHNLAAPPFDFLERCFLPLLEKMGPKVRVELQRYGFYPAGGGRFTAEIMPCPVLKPVTLDERGEIAARKAVAVVANLPYHIAKRELDTAAQALGLPAESLQCVDTKNSVSSGNLVMVEITNCEFTQIFTAFGQRRVSAETVAGDAAKQAQEYLSSKAMVDEHLADQLLLPMALAGGGSFTATVLNQHALTNMQVICEFLPVRFDVREHEGFTRVSLHVL
ncbi:MAG TPA: RNA 3'-terminal phosphate cyclase [Candidatus Angelobacter sp.]|nr:RNA 3'-terminal phosphate cyclase [Candidatus Angelobacter sp.]